MDRSRSGQRPRVVGLLDIGSFKVVCLIVAETGTGAGQGGAVPLRVVGVGHHRSQGVKAGVIADLEQVEAAVRGAVAQAERQAGVTLEEVVVAVSCGRLTSRNFAASAPVEGQTVSAEDIDRVMQGARVYAEREGRALVHMNRVGFRLDGVSGMLDPRGMAGRKLTADVHAVTADDALVRNLLMVLERCYLGAAGLVPAGLASALAVTTPEERRLGVTCIDIGGGSTTLAVFADGAFLFTDTIPMGASHITYDIARCLQTPLAEAERIKALYGTLVGAPSDEHEVIAYPLVGTDGHTSGQTSKAQLTSIVRPRFESVLTHIQDRLEKGGLAVHAGEHIVLTGGGSQLVGAAEFAANKLSRQVRIARPQILSGLPSALSSPAFATAVGLVGAMASVGNEAPAFRESNPIVQGYLGRVGEWLKQGF